MTKEKWRYAAALGLALVGLIAVMIGCRGAKSKKFSTSMQPQLQTSASGAETTGRTYSTGAERSNESLDVPLNRRVELSEFKAARDMMSMIREQMYAPSSERLLREMSSLGLNPMPSTSEGIPGDRRTVLRATESLDINTRHLAAQFRMGTKGEFLHSMSFEFRPGPEAMQEAEAVAREIFGIKIEPDDKDGDHYRIWKLDGGYEILINKITEKYFSIEMPDRVYTIDDLGVIQITVQRNAEREHDDH